MASGDFESFWLNFGGGVELKLNSKIAQRFVKPPLFVCVWNVVNDCWKLLINVLYPEFATLRGKLGLKIQNIRMTICYRFLLYRNCANTFLAIRLNIMLLVILFLL